MMLIILFGSLDPVRTGRATSAARTTGLSSARSVLTVVLLDELLTAGFLG